jgi:uroporphyrinogen-III synthase
VSAGRLEGLGVVITRPKSAADVLAAALEREGARTFVFPALEIEPSDPTPRQQEALERLGECGLAIFISANAVERALALVRSRMPWPERTRAAAVGEATAAALRNSGFEAVISPRERHDSEALLALPELRAIKGERIIVFRGEGGREHLREVLEARGAHVDYVECYRRTRPRVDPAPLLAAWARGELHAVSVLSAETLENFLTMVGEAALPRVSEATLVVPHRAIAAHPDARRFARVIVAAPGTAGLVDALSTLRVTP